MLGTAPHIPAIRKAAMPSLEERAVCRERARFILLAFCMSFLPEGSLFLLLMAESRVVGDSVVAKLCVEILCNSLEQHPQRGDLFFAEIGQRLLPGLQRQRK